MRGRFELRPLGDGPGGDADPPRALLRHDVDVSLGPALTLAEREAGWGVAASYMVQLDCPLYRVDDREGRAALARLVELGHEVGLHVDVESVPADSGWAGIEALVAAAARRLEELCRQRVRSVSFHRPTARMLRGPDRIAGLVNAYGASLMALYMSDSEGRWRGGEPTPRIRAAAGRLLQLLVHPVWWGERHLDPADRLQALFETTTAGMEPRARQQFDAELLRAVGPARRRGLA